MNNYDTCTFLQVNINYLSDTSRIPLQKFAYDINACIVAVVAATQTVVGQ